jgi:U3 small nucleolar RNA-associated protein 21
VETFNMQSGIKRKRFMNGHTRSITFVGLDRLNKTLVSAGSDGIVLLWDFKTESIKGRLDLGSAVTIGKIQNGFVALSCDDLSIKVIDTETPSGRVVRELWGHSNRITDFVFSPTSTWIISVSLDSTLRVWDLPTGFLISAVRLPSIATGIAFSPSGEFLATAHVGSLGIHLWSNRSQFRTIPVRRINEEGIPYLGEALPSISGRQGEGILEGAFDEEDLSEEEDITGISAVDQLSEELLTMSLQPRTKMWSLLNLEAIRRRNRAREPVKQPEKAPFFLPSLKDSTKAREGIEQPAPKPVTNDAPNTRILRFQETQAMSDFTRLLVSGESEELIQYMKTLSPSQLDYSIRAMDLLSPFTEPITYVKTMVDHLRTKKDFELVQAWMLAFLRIQQDWLVQMRDELGIREAMKEWEEAHRAERERITEIVGYVGGVLGFIRGI